MLGNGLGERLRHLLERRVVEGGEELADLARDVPAAGSEEHLSPQRVTLDGGIPGEGASPPLAHPAGDGHGGGQVGRDCG